jgi:hypothetical protein
MEIDFKKIQKEVLENSAKGKASKGAIKGKASGTLTENACNLIINNIKEIKLLDNEDVLVLITGLAQNGVSHAGAPMVYNYKNKNLSTQELYHEIHKIVPTATTRQFCRTLRNKIGQIAEILGEEGDLSNKMRIKFPIISVKEAVWCSSFQTGNPNCPDRVRHWLSEDLTNRFPPKK